MNKDYQVIKNKEITIPKQTITSNTNTSMISKEIEEIKNTKENKITCNNFQNNQNKFLS